MFFKYVKLYILYDVIIVYMFNEKNMYREKRDLSCYKN